MTELTFISGNQHKIDLLAKWLAVPIPHRKIDLPEIQSLDSHEVVAHKAREAYKIVGAPVLVEDVSMVFSAMGRLPGTFIKWFIEELGIDGLCTLASSLPDQRAVCTITYGLYDGATMEYFESAQPGVIASEPRGTNGFGWNAIFIPDGTVLTYAEMDDATVEHWSIRARALKDLHKYLTEN